MSNTLAQNTGSGDSTSSTYVHPEVALKYLVHATRNLPGKEDEEIIRERLFDTTVVTDTYTASWTQNLDSITNQRSSDGFYNSQMLMHGRFQVPKCKISAWFITSAGKALKESTRTKSMDH
jgi:hypothetical protein